MRVIKEIILHCSATRDGKNITASTIRQWHLQRGFNDIGYHFIIDLDGTIEQGRSESIVGAHCQGRNSNSIGICYIGGVDKNNVNKAKDTRTEAQRKALMELVNKLLKKYNLTISNVRCHNEFAKKACPSFNIATFRKEYKEYYKL